MKILLVEDDPSIQSIAQLALSRVGGHEVWIAHDGQQTLERCEIETPDLILLDVMMPKMNGFETCEKLKAKRHTRDIPIIFLTAKAQAHEMQTGMRLGAMGYILKPFDPMALPEQIEEIIKNYGAA